MVKVLIGCNFISQHCYITEAPENLILLNAIHMSNKEYWFARKKQFATSAETNGTSGQQIKLIMKSAF